MITGTSTPLKWNDSPSSVSAKLQCHSGDRRPTMRNRAARSSMVSRHSSSIGLYPAVNGVDAIIGHAQRIVRTLGAAHDADHAPRPDLLDQQQAVGPEAVAVAEQHDVAYLYLGGVHRQFPLRMNLFAIGMATTRLGTGFSHNGMTCRRCATSHNGGSRCLFKKALHRCCLPWWLPPVRRAPSRPRPGLAGAALRGRSSRRPAPAAASIRG